VRQIWVLQDGQAVAIAGDARHQRRAHDRGQRPGLAEGMAVITDQAGRRRAMSEPAAGTAKRETLSQRGIHADRDAARHHQDLRQRQAAFQALAGVDLDIDAGDFVAIMGPSGSGKSTVMNILGCLDTPTSGSYLFQGVAVER
jgi:ABC-type glutathione transport system ATPase component